MKIGVVGYGSIGQRHAANIEKLGHKPIVYDPRFRRDVKLEHHLYDSDVTAIVVATPSVIHESALRASVERGKHVLVEKPLSVAIGQAPELLQVAREKGLLVVMGNNLRFHPCVQKAATWLQSGATGAPACANFTCAQLSSKHPYLSNGVILNTGAHEVDLAMHLLGPAKVLCATASAGLYGEDIADFVLLHENGCRSSFHLDFVSRLPLRTFRIVGTEGEIFCNLIDRDLLGRQPDDKLPDVVHRNLYRGEGSWDTDYLNEMRTFIDLIEKTEPAIPPIATGADGLAVLRVLLDVRRAAGL